jgi:hypothetical protein
MTQKSKAPVMMKANTVAMIEFESFLFGAVHFSNWNSKPFPSFRLLSEDRYPAGRPTGAKSDQVLQCCKRRAFRNPQFPFVGCIPGDKDQNLSLSGWL